MILAVTAEVSPVTLTILNPQMVQLQDLSRAATTTVHAEVLHLVQGFSQALLKSPCE